LHHPDLRIAARTDGTLDLQRTSLRGFAQKLATSTDLTAWSSNDVTNSGEAWDAVTNNVTPSAQQFWRLRTVAP
jgi:hypothetical protein